MTRIEREKETIGQMIGLYCRHKEGNREMCDECRSLLEYACRRLEHCRYGNQKSACKDCPTHCYAPAHREKIREVMRYAGPRMLLYHPVATLRHMFRAAARSKKESVG